MYKLKMHFSRHNLSVINLNVNHRQVRVFRARQWTTKCTVLRDIKYQGQWIMSFPMQGFVLFVFGIRLSRCAYCGGKMRVSFCIQRRRSRRHTPRLETQLTHNSNTVSLTVHSLTKLRPWNRAFLEKLFFPLAKTFLALYKVHKIPHHIPNSRLLVLVLSQMNPEHGTPKILFQHPF